MLILGFLSGLLGMLALMALWPLPEPMARSQPDPAADYEAAIARFGVLREAETAHVARPGRSRLLTHGGQTAVVTVLVHGATSSPQQMVEMGRLLFAQGQNVLILRLPYHGYVSLRVGELASLRLGTLRAYADTAVDLAAGLGARVQVVGMSGGGTVAAWLAQNRPDVARVALIAPFFTPAGVPAWAAVPAIRLFGRLPSVTLSDPREERRPYVYRGQATRGAVAFMRLGQAVLAQAEEARAQAGEVGVLLIAGDSVVNNAATARLLAAWQAQGTAINTVTLPAERGVPHNGIDPSRPAEMRAAVYDALLPLLGVQFDWALWQRMTAVHS